MTDLSSIGFKKNSNTDTDPNDQNDDVESAIGKAGKDYLFSKQQFNNNETYKIPEAPFIPENPLNKTNEKLGDLESLIQVESSRSSKSTKNWNRVMLFVSLIALVTSAFFSVLSYISSNQSSAKLEKLISEQNALLKANLASSGLNEIELDQTKPPVVSKEDKTDKSSVK